MHHKLAISYFYFYFLDVGQNPDNSISLRKFHFSCCCCSLTTVLEQVLEHNNMEYSDTPVCVIHSGIFGTSADWHTQWHHPKHPNVGRGKKNRKTFWGWRMSKNGNTARVFSAASVLNSLAYLWFSSKTVTHCGEGRLALVIGFNRKCGVTSERGGRDGGAGREGGGNGAQTQLRLPLDADKPLLSPDRGS